MQDSGPRGPEFDTPGLRYSDFIFLLQTLSDWVSLVLAIPNTSNAPVLQRLAASQLTLAHLPDRTGEGKSLVRVCVCVCGPTYVICVNTMAVYC